MQKYCNFIAKNGYTAERVIEPNLPVAGNELIIAIGKDEDKISMQVFCDDPTVYSIFTLCSMLTYSHLDQGYSFEEVMNEPEIY